MNEKIKTTIAGEIFRDNCSKYSDASEDFFVYIEPLLPVFNVRCLHGEFKFVAPIVI